MPSAGGRSEGGGVKSPASCWVLCQSTVVLLMYMWGGEQVRGGAMSLGGCSSVVLLNICVDGEGHK